MQPTNRRLIAIVSITIYLSHLVALPVLANAPALSSSTPGVTFSGVGTSNLTITSSALRSIVSAPQGFNIAPTDVTSIIQATNAAMLIRIGDLNPTSINGHLNAMGLLFLLNPNGILFGPNAQVNVGGLIASSLHLSDADFLRGNYLFQGAGVEGWVKNAGNIHATGDGVYLFAPNVENSGIITSPGGNIVLGAGSTAFLSNRPDGRGFLAEISAPTGHAVNLRDLIADGGNITLAGRVVNQEGLVQANSVREQNGKIELVAGETATLTAGSRTLATGGEDGVSSGGTIRVLADLTNGQAAFEKGALLNVSGGKQGGDAGFAEVSAATVKLGGQFMGRAVNGYHGGRFLIDPVTTVGFNELASFAGSGASLVEFKSPAGSGLTVTGTYDLAAVVTNPNTGLQGNWQLPAGQTGTLKFTATTGDLVFQDVQLRNLGSGTGSPWNYIGTADGNILFNRSFVETGFGGSMAFTATNGKISLLDPLGTLSILRIPAAGGNLTLRAGTDIISPSVIVKSILSGSDSTGDKLGGIRLDGPGNLVIEAGNDVVGGRVFGLGNPFSGPGFVLTNGTATVTAGRNIGGPTIGATFRDDDEYANLTLATGTINLTANTGNIYLGRVQDKGLSDRSGNVTTMTVDPTNQVVLTALKGDIHLSPQMPTDAFAGAGATGRWIYPASFTADAKNGNIVIERGLKFWASPTGTIKFSAGKDIVGSQQTAYSPDTVNYAYIFVGSLLTGGEWVLVNLATAGTNPILAPFLNSMKNPPFGALAPPTTGTPPDPVHFAWMFVGTVGAGGQWVLVNPLAAAHNPLLSPYLGSITSPPAGAPPSPPTGYPTITSLGSPPSVKIMEADPALFKGLFRSTTFLKNLNSQATNVAPHDPADVTVQAGTANVAGTGKIQALILDFSSVPFRKRVTLDAATDIVGVTAKIAVPDGVIATVSAGGSINMRRASPDLAPGELSFSGTGTARVRVGGLLDLADSAGINFRLLPIPTSDHNKGGFLDLAVGGSIQMDTSRIASYNGATISIHGLGKDPLVDGNGNPRIENGKPVALVGTASQGSDGHSHLFVNGNEVTFDGRPVLLDGAQPVTGPVTLHVALVEQGNGLLLANGQRVEVVRAEGKPVIVNGNVVLESNGTVLLADVNQVSVVRATGGDIIVGSSASTNTAQGSVPLGILTLRGGAVDIKATGTIDVAKSRIATFGSLDTSVNPAAPYKAGDINIVSTKGSISAGSGGADEVTQLTFQDTDPATGKGVLFTAEVPGSGIFSYHSSDQARGEKLVFPRFDDPEINALRNEIFKQGFFGHDTSALRAKEQQLLAERAPIFTQIFEKFITDKHLGNISLFAQQGNIIVPAAGIRGRRVTLLAPQGTLDLQGGVISGLTTFSAGQVQGSVTGSFSGSVTGASSSGAVSGASSAGGGSLGGISGASGAVAAGSASSTAAATSSAAKSTESVQEAAVDAGGQQSGANGRQVASKKNDEKDGKRTVAQSLKVKQGVTIQVDVKAQQGG